MSTKDQTDSTAKVPLSRRTLTALDRLTIDAARRVIRTRLRQHVWTKAQEADRRRGNSECIDLILDAEKGIEADALASWVSTLALRNGGRPDADAIARMRKLIPHALAEAMQASDVFLESRLAEYGRDDVRAWALDFLDGFKADALHGAS